MNRYLAVAFELVNMGSLFYIFICERRDTKLEQTARIDKQPIVSFIRQLHPTYIRTITRSLRLYIVVEHPFNSRIVYANLAGLFAVGIGFMVPASQIRYISIGIVHFEDQSQTRHCSYHRSIRHKLGLYLDTTVPRQ